MPEKRHPAIIAVIGAGQCDGKVRQMALEIGQEIARSGAILICGGLSGVMRAAAEGAKAENGVTVGILPGNDKAEANEFIDFRICTGLGEARYLIIIKTADAVIALPGRYGTLSELGFALKVGKPVVSYGSWEVSDEIIRANNAKEAVQLALQAIPG